MQKNDSIEQVEDEIEQAEQDSDDAGSIGETTATKVAAKLHIETTPIEKRNYVSYFMTLEERRNIGLLVKYNNVKPEPLSGKVVGALDTLFVNNKVHLYLPWWSDEKKHNPIDFYELRFSSNGAGPRKFASPYDPILIRREKQNEIVAVVYKGYIFRRDATPMLLELFMEMANDPAEFFERVGKRWGRCLCCKREITADKSIERAIGPVCYKRIKKVVKFITQVNEDIEIESSEVVIVPTARGLNPVEYDGVVEMSNMYLGALKCGFEFDSHFGAMLVPGDVGDRRYCGELMEVEGDKNTRYSRQVGRARKECVAFRVTEEIPCTVSVLTQLDARWDEEKKVWLVLKDYKRKLGEYFRIKWKNNKRQLKATSSSSSTSSSYAIPSSTISSTSSTIPSSTSSTATATSSSSITNTQKIWSQLVNDEIELGGVTYPYRTLIRDVGGKWNKDRKVWTVPIESKDKVDELMRKINNN